MIRVLFAPSAIAKMLKSNNRVDTWYEDTYAPDTRPMFNPDWQGDQLRRTLDENKDEDAVAAGERVKQGEYGPLPDGFTVPRRPTPDAAGRVPEYDHGSWAANLPNDEAAEARLKALARSNMRFSLKKR